MSLTPRIRRVHKTRICLVWTCGCAVTFIDLGEDAKHEVGCFRTQRCELPRAIHLAVSIHDRN